MSHEVCLFRDLQNFSSAMTIIIIFPFNLIKCSIYAYWKKSIETQSYYYCCYFNLYHFKFLLLLTIFIKINEFLNLLISSYVYFLVICIVNMLNYCYLMHCTFCFKIWEIIFILLFSKRFWNKIVCLKSLKFNLKNI